MTLFNILFVFSCIMLVSCIIIKKILSKMFRKFYKTYVCDYKFKEVREGGSNNSYYLVSSVDSNYIPRYVLRNSVYEKSIVVNYSKPYEYISYYVAQFDKKNKLIDLIKVFDKNTSTTSRVLLINKKTNSVNVVVSECDGSVINHGYIIPKSRKQYFVEQLLGSISLFSLMFVVLYITLRLWLRDLAYTYLTSSMCAILLLAILFVTIIYLIVSTLILDNKSKKDHLGGKVYYEFF